MKKSKLKKRLEQDLPYPKLTSRANQRFDAILSALPEQERVRESAARKKPAHYAEKPARPEKKTAVLREKEKFSADVVYGEPEIVRRSWGKTAAKCALSLGTLCLVAAVAVRWVLPGVWKREETTPLKPTLASFPSLPPPAEPSSLPDSSFSGLEVNDFFIGDDSIFHVELTFPLPPLSALYNGAPAVPEFVVRTETGEQLELYESSCNDAEIEKMLPGETYTASFTFAGNFEDTGRLYLTAYNCAEGDTRFFPDGSVRERVVLEEYVLNPATGEVTSTRAYLARGEEKIPLGEYIEMMAGGPEFRNHLFALQMYESVAEKSGCEWSIRFFADMADPLNYQATIYLDGEPYAVLPLYPTEDSEWTENGFYTKWEQGLVEMERVSDAPWYYYSDTVQAVYTLTATFDYGIFGEVDSSRIRYEITDLDTGEVYAKSEEGERIGASLPDDQIAVPSDAEESAPQFGSTPEPAEAEASEVSSQSPDEFPCP